MYFKAKKKAKSVFEILIGALTEENFVCESVKLWNVGKTKEEEMEEKEKEKNGRNGREGGEGESLSRLLQSSKYWINELVLQGVQKC